ncbi:hypothetical protein ACIO6U_03695 [Streptomyces sp. NPDC087422]|uniref:hypothetical protein n=1 Tax=Streptomyces sp. NPDC087422 TaxID=3365786 RepID=UPI0037FDA843
MYVPGTGLDGLRADLGPIPLGGVDELGVAWVLQTLDGWDSPEIRAQVQQREGDHGAWSGARYLGERPITLAGTVVAPDPAALDDARERLLSAASLSDTTVVVYEQTPKQALAHRSAKPLWKYETDVAATYSVMMTADDPRRYATVAQSGTTMLPITTGGMTYPRTYPLAFNAVTVSGQVDCANLGSFETRPVLVIDGPVSQPAVLAQMPDGSVRPMTYSQDLSLGDQLVIDVDAKSVMLNGNVSRRRFLAVPLGWPVIPPEALVSFRFVAATYTATAALTVRWRSAWI